MRSLLVAALIVLVSIVARRTPVNLAHGFVLYGGDIRYQQKYASVCNPGGDFVHATISSKYPSLISLRASSSSREESTITYTFVQDLLRENGYGQRLLTLSRSQLPVVAELFSHGRFELCRILSLVPSSKENSPPLARVSLLANENDDGQLVDLGQITTIWERGMTTELKDSWKQVVRCELDRFPVQHSEHTMHRLYNSVQGRAGSSNIGLSKKQISSIVANAPEHVQSLVDGLLRKVVKTGRGMSRLIDSSVAMDFLYEDYPKQGVEAMRRQIVGASVLADDAALGGRFKRMGSSFVSSSYDTGGELDQVTIINGGWLAVDQSVRVGTEARKFAGRSAVDPRDGEPTMAEQQLRTAADERIAQRLECLAMGEVFSAKSNHNIAAKEGDRKLAQDVGDALKAMDLPATPEGARGALVRIGRWSEGSGNIKLEPWGRETLDAAVEYAELDGIRRENIYQQISSDKADGAEGRVNLTRLPCICIDAKRTSFRDDAIGIRARSSTGRKILEGASKWEILVHVADVSDIYSPAANLPCNKSVVDLLRDAAASRGESRYDLPLGPLHLLPPVVLDALSLETVSIASWNETPSPTRQHKAPINRCLTLWAYIDEKDGKLLDAGVERSLISTPLALNFAQSTSLLEGKVDGGAQKKAMTMLTVVERNLLLWTERHQKENGAAKKREERLSARELVAMESLDAGNRDDGRSGFQRTRGHRLVDASLNLYGFTLARLMRRAHAAVPWVAGSGASRGGRIGTAPLRRFVDGVAQRQALSALCDYGGSLMSKEECIEVGKIATQAKNKLNNIRSMTRKEGAARPVNDRQRQALRLLQSQLSDRNRPLPAISSGRHNEVVISGVGAVAKCGGIKGTIKPGERIMVRVKKLDSAKGTLSVELVNDS